MSGCYYGSGSTNGNAIYDNDTQYVFTPDGLLICLPDDDITYCF